MSLFSSRGVMSHWGCLCLFFLLENSLSGWVLLQLNSYSSGKDFSVILPCLIIMLRSANIFALEMPFFNMKNKTRIKLHSFFAINDRICYFFFFFFVSLGV
ncbi:hypothetical protein Hanom_Chr07g00582851 [Helianthus anomalus]